MSDARATWYHSRVGDSACIPSAASAVPTTTVASRHSALVRVTHWITTLCFLALLVTGVEIVISHPRFYWGETGNDLTPAVVQTADPCLEVIGADRLRVRAAGPERLEPVSPLSSCLGGGIDRLAVRNLRFVYRAFSEELGSRVRPIVRGERSQPRSFSHLRFQRPSAAGSLVV